MRRRRRKPDDPCSKSEYRALVLNEEKRLYEFALKLAREGMIRDAINVARLIEEIATATRVRPPRRIRRGICRNCRAPLIPGLTSRVRLKSQGGLSYIIVRCLVCGWIHRYPYKNG